MQRKIELQGLIHTLGGVILNENNGDTGDYAENLLMVVNDIPCIITQVGGVLSWCPLIRGYNSAAYHHVQSTVATQWTIQHNLATSDLWVVVINSDTKQIVRDVTITPDTGDPTNKVMLSVGGVPIKGEAYVVGTLSWSTNKLVTGEIDLGANLRIDSTKIHYGSNAIDFADLVQLNVLANTINTTLSTQITALASKEATDVATLSGNIDSNATAISALQTTVTSLTSSIGSNVNAITALQGSVSANNAAIATLQSTVAALGLSPKVSVRHAVQSGPTDNNGRAVCVVAGSGFACNLAATSAALVMAFAAGFNSLGAVDYVETFASDVAGFWAGIPANVNALLGMKRVAAGNVVPKITLAPPQQVYHYDSTQQSLVHFNGTLGSTTILDDFGNVWTAIGGAKLQSNWSKFGTTALGGAGLNNALTGGDYVKSTAFTKFANDSWSIRGRFVPNAALANNGIGTLFNFSAATNALFGILLGVKNVNGTTKTYLSLSSNGTSWDILNGGLGTTVFALNTEYYIELVYDALANAYYLYVNGHLDQVIASTSHVCNFVVATIGANVQGGNGYLGYVAEFELLPYVEHPAGTTYVVPTTKPSITNDGYAAEWFDVSSYVMKAISAPSTVPGTLPTFSKEDVLYVGEAFTNGSGVTSVISYGYLGQYDSGPSLLLANNTRYVLSHNLGTIDARPVDQYLIVVNPVNGYNVGDRIALPALYNKNYALPVQPLVKRNSLLINTTTSGLACTPSGGGNFAVFGQGDVMYGIVMKRNF